jgi:hypothetical protein
VSWKVSKRNVVPSVYNLIVLLIQCQQNSLNPSSQGNAV